MNHIFKTKWCHTYQSYVVCSELAKSAGKVSGVLASTLLLSNAVLADLPKTISTDETLAGTTYTETLSGPFFNINGNANAQFNGDMTFNITANGDNEPRFDVTNGNLTTNGKLTINITPDGNTKHTRPKGMIIRGESAVDIKDLAVKVVLANEDSTLNSSPDSNASYGIALGYDHNGGSADKISTLTLENAKIIVENTENSIFNTLTLGPAKVKKGGHQLSGLKLFRTGGSQPIFTSTGTLDINVTDKSTQKVGDYLVGIYISGNGTEAHLNNTKINVAANGKHSAAIKIGKPNLPNKPVADDYKGSTVFSKGHLEIDTTETKDSASIRLFEHKSKLLANYDTSSSVIKSANSAISYDTTDYEASINYFLTVPAYRNENGTNQEVKLKNAVISTTSDTASLIVANTVSRSSLAVTYGATRYPQVNNWFNNGKFSVKNAIFELSGDKSVATAANKGWLIEVQGLADTSSDLTATISDGAKIIGSVHKEHSSKLDLTLDNATWELKKKDTETTSTLNSLTLNNNAILDATLPTIAQADLDQTLDTAKQKLEEAKNLTKDGNVLFALLNEDEFNEYKEKAIAQTEAAVAEAEKNAKQGERAEYTLKLSSDSNAIDGTLTNDGGVINLANQHYADHLTVQGNYVASGEAKLKVNTLWNSPADENGINSQSDLLEITGTATGSTQIISVSKDGKENVLDGNIGSLAADLGKNSVAIVRVHTLEGSSETPFTGKAKTTGAGEVQITSREVDDPNNTGKKMKEFFWTLTALNRPDTPILSPVVPAYVQMPQINLAQGYATLRTLHTRRGENQILAWDNDQLVKKQSWGRFLGSHLYTQGKTRLGFEMDIVGAQVGYDFDIRTNEKNTRSLTGVYAALTQSKARFSDRLRTENGVVQADKFTGSGKAKSWSLGLTHTRYVENGSYVDLVGQLSFFSNKYHSRDDVKAKNKGVSYLLSAEVGRPYILKASEQHQAHWLIEPQAQLVYQYLNSKKFNDGLKQVTPKDVHHLRGRAGFRLAYNQPADKNNPHTKSLYLTANILHDFTSGNKVQIGQDTIREKYDQTWWDIGLGIQHPIGKKAYVYLDGHYEGNFSGKRTREGYRGSVGIKYSW